MATIKAYTDLSQSKKLAEILPLESADMTYYACVKDWHGNSVEPKWGKPTTLTKEELALPCSNFQEYEYVHCWSLAALLNIVSTYCSRLEITLRADKNYNIFAVSGDFVFRSFDECSEGYNNIVDACYEMIIRLNELKLL